MMIKNNKVISNVLLPKILSLAVLVTFITASGVYVAQGDTQSKTYIPGKNICMLSLIALLIVCIYADVHSDYKKGVDFSKMIGHKYLKQEMKKQPELKQFEKVLDNPQAMQNVSAVIFNSLRPSERKIVAQIILDMRQDLRDHKKYGSDDTKTSLNAKKIISDARNHIIPVIQAHAAIHPEFINDVYSALASANNTLYIMSKNSIQQHIK